MAVILVVDDSPVVQRTLAHVLRKGGHTPLAALGADEAQAQLAAQPCDLIVLDLAMPDVDGLALLRRLRADPAHARRPVIMLTASGDDRDRVAARAAGADVFLTKPVSSLELGETVRRLLERPPA